MFPKSDIEKFQQETGIKDDRVDSIIASVEAGMLGGLNDTTYNGTTCSNANEKPGALSEWLLSLIKGSKTEGTGASEDEDVYDSTWSYVPEALPAPEQESEGE